LIRKTSAQLSLSPAIVEKDYWLCLLLSYLFNDSPYKDSLLFKGGTCLSKCFDLIQRFSEDLDVSIAWDILAYSGNDPLAYRNRTQRKKFNDEARQETDDFVKGPFLASLDKGLTEAWGFKPTITPSSESIATLIVEFPHEFTTSYIRPTLLLEMGSLSAKGPVVQRQIVPMAASFYSFSPISVRCLAPERTFWEKISILYRETQRPSQKMTPRRYSRHFYDIYRLSFSPYYLSALSQPNILDDVILMKDTFFPDTWMKCAEMKKNFTIIPGEERLQALEQDYEQMQFMLYGPVPSWQTILFRLREVEKDIREAILR
jgi:Uncharacterized conserved protein